jgi:selenide,water dikinase
MVHRRDEVICGIAQEGPGDDAALLRPPAPPAYLVHTIDYFRSFVSDPYLFGQIAANHALSDVYAMNGEPVSALALAVLPYGPEDMVEDTLVQMLAGCLEVLGREGCALVGGHTSEGADSALGLAVHGVVHPAAALRKALRPRDLAAQQMVLVLTKPLGTGTIMAAHMRAKAKGGWVLAAHRSMLVSNRAAAGLLHRFGCVACTDVTGFGLLGHLLEMIQGGEEASEVGEGVSEGLTESLTEGITEGITEGMKEGMKEGTRALRTSVTLHLSRIPTLPGAIECVHDLGITSSLHPSNVRCVRAVRNPQLGSAHQSYPLLFDPQVTFTHCLCLCLCPSFYDTYNTRRDTIPLTSFAIARF